MCGNYYLGKKTMRKIYDAAESVDRRFSSRDMFLPKDIFPADSAPVIIGGSGRSLNLSLQRWGYPGVQNKVVIFNARQETVWEKKLFAGGIRYHRAVIPADHFYEWNANREKYTFRRKDGEPLLLAGFFDVLQNEERFVILTTESNASMAPVHDRMPVILEKNQLKDWLYDEHAAAKILKEVPILLEKEIPYEQMTLF